jgi:hypothetical protein
MSAPKGYSPGAVWKNLGLALRGNKHAGDVQQYVDYWEFLLRLMPEPNKFNRELMRYHGHTEKTVAEGFAELNAITRNIMQDALKRRDGSILKKIAEFIDARDELSDKQRLWLLALCFDWTPPRKQKAFFTCRELVEMAKERIGWITDQRRMLSICTSLGIKLTQGKPGRPRNSEKRRVRQS